MSDNKMKSLHGRSAIDQVKLLFEEYKSIGFIKEYKTPYRGGYPDINDRQFFFQFSVTFSDDEIWIIQSTTSFRERINTQQWNAEHLKKNESKIKKALIVYPDNIPEKELHYAKALKEKVTENKIYSALDDVVSLSDLYFLIEEKHFEKLVGGSQKARKGSNFEKFIVNILNNDVNRLVWNNDGEYKVGFNFPYFKRILKGIGVDDSRRIKKIEATNEIGLLPSRGKPKTDILLRIIFSDETEEIYTFTCKRTESEWVSVHQYSIDKFITVLKISNPSLIQALKEFQNVGGLKAMSVEGNKCLEEEMPKYNKELAEWVYGGVGGEGDPKTQWARYVINFRSNLFELEVYSLEEYVDKVLEIKEHYGTPYKWTYASGSKGKSIQFKGKII